MLLARLPDLDNLAALIATVLRSASLPPEQRDDVAIVRWPPKYKTDRRLAHKHAAALSKILPPEAEGLIEQYLKMIDKGIDFDRDRRQRDYPELGFDDGIAWYNSNEHEFKSTKNVPKGIFADESAFCQHAAEEGDCIQEQKLPDKNVKLL
jgi:hypothetical protein